MLRTTMLRRKEDNGAEDGDVEGEDRSQGRNNCFVQARGVEMHLDMCAAEMHLDMSQEPFYISRENVQVKYGKMPQARWIP